MAVFPLPEQPCPANGGTACCRLRAGWLTTGKSGNRRGDVGRIPFPECRQGRVSQRTTEIGPDPGLVAQILRLAVAPVEPRKGAEQAGVPLRRHDGVELGKARRIEADVGGAARLDVA